MEAPSVRWSQQQFCRVSRASRISRRRGFRDNRACASDAARMSATTSKLAMSLSTLKRSPRARRLRRPVSASEHACEWRPCSKPATDASGCALVASQRSCRTHCVARLSHCSPRMNHAFSAFSAYALDTSARWRRMQTQPSPIGRTTCAPSRWHGLPAACSASRLVRH